MYFINYINSCGGKNQMSQLKLLLSSNSSQVKS